MKMINKIINRNNDVNIYAIVNRNKVAGYYSSSNKTMTIKDESNECASLKLLINILQDIKKYNRTNNTIILWKNLYCIMINENRFKNPGAKMLFNQVLKLKKELNGKVTFKTSEDATFKDERDVKNNAWALI